MERDKGTPKIFDEALMKRTFEEYLLPFCSARTVIRGCRRSWSKYQPLKGTLQAVYQVDFADPKKGQHFSPFSDHSWGESDGSQQLYLVIPGESRMVAGMPEKGELDEGESSSILSIASCKYPIYSDLQVSYLYIRPLKLLIQVFPTDMKLPHLRTLVNPTAILPYLQAYTDLNKMEIRRITVLRYKPEKRCVIRYDLARYAEKPTSIREYSAIGKTFYDDRGRGIFRIMQFLRRSGLSVPEPLSYIPELKLLLTEYLHGRMLESLVAEPNFPVYIKGAARAVARLHRVPVDRKFVEIVSLEGEAERFADRLERFQQEYPLVKKKKIEYLVSTILRKLKNCGGKHLTFVHGEFDPGQLIVSDSKIWFVDFDLFKISHPAQDVGRFLAYLNRLSLRLYGNPDRLGTMEKLFLEEYLSLYHGDDDLQRQILIWQAMESIKISIIQSRRRKSDWEFLLSSMLEMAEKVLSSV